jgi:opacity protein-like surface antigen
MRKVILLAMFILCCASLSFAQDVRKVEVAAGFSVDSIDLGRIDTGDPTITVSNANSRETAYGFDTSVTGFVNKSFGIEGNIDGHYKNKDFTVTQTVGTVTGTTNVSTRLSTYNFMAGPHVRFAGDNSKVTPFVHGLLGANHSRVNATAFGDNIRDSETDFALKLGGGVDFDVHKNVAIRLAADYNPVFEKNNDTTVGLTTTSSGHRTRNDAMFSVGLVFK